MLAPLFDDVEERFSVYVTELRQILRMHNLQRAGASSISEIADGLAKSQELRVDVGRMMRAIIRREREQISSVELLAILMRAAGHAPAEPTALGSETAVEEILAFILEARYPQNRAEESGSPFVRTAKEPEQIDQPVRSVTRERDLEFTPMIQSDEEQEGSRRRVLLVAACLGALGLAVPFFMHEHGAGKKGTDVAVFTEAKGSGAAAQGEATGRLAHHAAAEPRVGAMKGVRSSREYDAEQAGRATLQVPDTRAQHSGQVVKGMPLQTDQSGDAMQGDDSPVNDVGGSGASHRAIVPVDLRTPTATDARKAARGGAGFVRAASAGIMAGNVISSPAPAYPAEAVSAGVQGEVTVQAIVGRDGSVTEARVVSGPPLLREAAVQAVEQWQYRPYMVYGKPAAMATTAILEFKLPRS